MSDHEYQPACRRCGSTENIVEIELKVNRSTVLRHGICEHCFSWALSVLARFLDPFKQLLFDYDSHQDITGGGRPRKPMGVDYRAGRSVDES